MPERKSVSPKVRFEVFKRDSFTCQYCGKKAPDVILECDHIKPVATGGDNDILNLATSCRECNAGKGARELTDSQAIEAQRAQLEELEERRQQMEWVVQWRDELRDLEDHAVEMLNARLIERGQHGMSEPGKTNMRKWVDRYGFDEVLQALDTSFDQYIERDDEGRVTDESWCHAFDKIPGIISVNRRSKEKPYLKDLFYIRGILRNRIYVNERQVMNLLERAHLAGWDIDNLKEFAKSVRTWTSFRDELWDFILENEEDDGAN